MPTHLVLGGVADEALGVRERDIGGRGTVALVVGNDLNAVVLPDTDAAGEGGRKARAG
jgi:hypothetical protein